MLVTVSGDHAIRPVFIVSFREIIVDGVAYKMLNRTKSTSRSIVNYSSEILEEIQTLQLTLLVALLLYIVASR